MMTSILSDTIYIDKKYCTTQEIEAILVKKYGSIIRWAVVEVEENRLKLTVTYETGAQI